MNDFWTAVASFVGLKIISDTFNLDVKKFPTWVANKFPFFVIGVFGLFYLLISKFRKPNPDADKVFIVAIIVLVSVVAFQKYLKAKGSRIRLS